MPHKTARVLALALGVTACNGLGNPGDSDGNTSASTTAVPPWMGSDTGTPTTGGDATTGPASTGTSTTTTTGDVSTGTTIDSTGDTTGDPPAPKLDLPPSPGTGEHDDDDDDDDDEHDDEGHDDD